MIRRPTIPDDIEAPSYSESTFGISTSSLLNMQRGYVTPTLRYGNQNQSQPYNDFKSALESASNYNGYIGLTRNNIVSERVLPFKDDRRYTESEWSALVTQAIEITRKHDVPQDIAENFLITLTNINNLQDIKKIADSAQLPDLYNAELLLNPEYMLSLQNLSRLGPMASAFNAFISPFAGFRDATQLADNVSDTFDTIFDSIGGLLGGFGLNNSESSTAKVLLSQGSGATLPSSFMMERITGTRVPVTVIAKNPQMHSPSYVGRTFFGQFPGSKMVVDMNQIHLKKIAVFGEYCCGAGTPMFNYQNMGKYSDSLSISTVINNVLYGKNALEEGGYDFGRASSIASSVASELRSDVGTQIEMRRADNSIPFMLALSGVLAEMSKSPFPSSVFREGWYISSSIGNDLQVSNPDFMLGFRSFT